MSLGLIHDDCFLDHETGNHPERPTRLEVIDRALRSTGVVDSCFRIEFDPAYRQRLETVHSSSQVDLVYSTAQHGGGFLDTDTVVGPESANVASKAVGGALAAADAVIEGRTSCSMCLVRPPGHHATPTRSMGFCLFNNVAITAEYLLEEKGVEKIAILDFDVHHGNGTQDAFYDRRDVFFLSVHQWPHYPGTGAATERGRGDGEGCTLNVPLPGIMNLLPGERHGARGWSRLQSLAPTYCLCPPVSMDIVLILSATFLSGRLQGT